MGGSNDNTKTRANKKNTKENDNDQLHNSNGGIQMEIQTLHSDVQALQNSQQGTSSHLDTLMKMMETHHKEGQAKMDETLQQVKANQSTVNDFISRTHEITDRLDNTDRVMNKHDADISAIKASINRLETAFSTSMDDRPNKSTIIEAAKQAATEVARNTPQLKPLIPADELEQLLQFKDQQVKRDRQENEATFIIRGLPKNTSNPLEAVAKILGPATADELVTRNIRPFWLKPRSTERADSTPSWPALVHCSSIREKVALRNILSRACSQQPHSTSRLSFDDYIPSELTSTRDKAMTDMKALRTRLGKDIRAFRFEFRDGQLKTAVRASKELENARPDNGKAYKTWTYIPTDGISMINTISEINFKKAPTPKPTHDEPHSSSTPAREERCTPDNDKEMEDSPSIPDTPEDIREGLKRMASSQAQQPRRKDARGEANLGE